MTKPTEKKNQPKTSSKLKRLSHSHLDISRRGFLQYSTFALMAAALPIPLVSCGDDGDGGGDNSTDNNPLQITLDQKEVAPGNLLGIEVLSSPGGSDIPEDNFSILISVDQKTSYHLRPILFREGWIGVFLPPMLQEDGSYFETHGIEISLSVEGGISEPLAVMCVQDLLTTNDGTSILSLLDDVTAELESIDLEKDTLFDSAATDSWNAMYPLVLQALQYLADIITEVQVNGTAEVTTLSGDAYTVTERDIALAALMIENLSDTRTMVNAFYELMPDPGRDIILKLNALLDYALPGAFLVATRGMADTAEGSGIQSTLLTALVPAACMCVAASSLKITLGDESIEQAAAIAGINWFANHLNQTGLNVISNKLVCDFTADQDEAFNLVARDAITLLEHVCGGFWTGTSWSNTVPWGNTVPWSNASQWNNDVWTNHPWNHAPWNNVVLWNNNIWNHNIWNNMTPWSNNPWDNGIWSHAAPWGNTPWSHSVPWNNAWANTPWGNTPWGNTPWSNAWTNTPWGNWANTPWSNNWNNFVNSGSQNL
jgi:hypothetical protein